MRKLMLSVFTIMLVVMVASLGIAAAMPAFKAVLSGKEDSVTTPAKGEAVFRLGKGGTELSYDIRVKGIEGVTSAHIHKGKMGESGEPVANLFTGPEKNGKFSGDLIKGVITDKDLYGELQGKTMDDLVKMIKAGELYVNVHTEKYPDGEIRGQIK